MVKKYWKNKFKSLILSCYCMRVCILISKFKINLKIISPIVFVYCIIICHILFFCAEDIITHHYSLIQTVLVGLVYVA